MTRRLRLQSALLGAGCALLTGCGDPLDRAQELNQPRILGVRVNGPGGEATLSTQQTLEQSSASEQRYTFEVLVAGPEGPLDTRFAYRWCEAAESSRGVPYCKGRAFAEGEQPLTGPIELGAFDGLRPGGRLALLGVACPEGEPVLPKDPNGWRCAGAKRALGVSFDAFVGRGNAVNENPDLSALEVVVGKQRAVLEATDVPPECNDAVPELDRGKPYRVELRLGAGARESLAANASRETLQLSHFSSAGLFERAFSFVDPNAKSVSGRLEWRAPKQAGPVKHYLVVRDERGGVSWASWSLCLR